MRRLGDMVTDSAETAGLEAVVARQYADGARLAARGYLRARFRTNPYTWTAWLFDHLRLPSQARIIELGCGLGWLWRANQGRIPPGWAVTLSDLSPGMVREAQQNLRQCPHPFAFAVVDAQEIPYPNASFDAVIANHMLYHVPDRPRALAEIRRVLAPGGRLYASTIGVGHLRELAELAPGRWGEIGRRFPFTLDSGEAQLRPFFAHVALHRHDDTLHVTEAAPLLAYLASLSPRPLPADVVARIESAVVERGAIDLTCDAGLFEAWGDEVAHK